MLRNDNIPCSKHLITEWQQEKRLIPRVRPPTTQTSPSFLITAMKIIYLQGANLIL